MLKRIVILIMSLVVPSAAFAGSIVTWEAFGITNYANSFFPGSNQFQSPPLGTLYSVQLQFDPTASVPTPSAPAGSGCSTTAVTGSFVLGGVSYALSGQAFTNSLLPATNCKEGVLNPGYPLGAIEFFLDPTALGLDTWHLNEEPSFLNFSYYDGVAQNGTFPTAPTPLGAGFFLYKLNDNFEFGGSFLPQAITTQPAPVPEPGTMVLVGIGLFAVARRVRGG